MEEGAAWRAALTPQPSPAAYPSSRRLRQVVRPEPPSWCRAPPSPPPRVPGLPRCSWQVSRVGSMAWTRGEAGRLHRRRLMKPRGASRCAEPARASGNQSLCPAPCRQARRTWDHGAWGSCRAAKARGQRQASPAPAAPAQQARCGAARARRPSPRGLKAPRAEAQASVRAGNGRLLGLVRLPSEG